MFHSNARTYSKTFFYITFKEKLIYFQMKYLVSLLHAFVLRALCPQTLSIVLLLDFSLTVKAATLIFISGRVSAISSAKEGKSGFNL